ncbi:discoidin domain-containing protein [Actinomadura scrupuli]|uniref:discoidin domain-containing protein n=1 Tax=Actinomadura scrupuli TaxID=559629 RepID=UPI003D96C0E3
MPRRTPGLCAAALAALALTLTTPVTPARAELTHPRQDWLRASTSGLFLHWGLRTNPAHTSCGAWENDVTGGGWSADYWVAEAQKLHARYLVLASFHSRLGYARAWPSKIPGSCSTKRDYLGELTRAAKAKGLKVILYMTNDPQWHDEGGHEWLDSSAYSDYKRRSVDLTTSDGFGEYSYDNFVEVMRNYPDLAGFWIDNDSQYWIDHGLYERIRSERPDMLLSNNNEDTPIMDTVSNEQKTGMTPPYDYPAATWSPAPRLTEACYKLPSTGAWWYDGSNSPVDKALNVGRLVTNAGSSIKSLMAETAQVNGVLPANQASYNNFLNGYLAPIWSSINGTEGGGYMYGGLQPGSWNDGAYGVTTISKTDPNLHYVHVLTKPAGSTLKVRDNGYHVSGVTNLRTGAALDVTQSGGSFTITGITGWDSYDTVLKVVTSGRTGIHSGVTATASAAKSGYPASNLVDGGHLKWWDNNTTLPVTITLDLGSAKKVAYLGVNQREWSVSYARSSTEDSARIKAYKVLTSTDGSTWTTVKTGTMASARGVRFIDLGIASTRYVRLEVDSTWAASSATKFAKKLLIDELWLGSGYA